MGISIRKKELTYTVYHQKQGSMVLSEGNGDDGRVPQGICGIRKEKFFRAFQQLQGAIPIIRQRRQTGGCRSIPVFQ